MSQKIYLTILKTGVYLSFISFFVVAESLLFPYVTGKQFYFNILIEILFVFWVAFIIKYPSYRPQKNWISIGLVAFMAALFASAIFGVDFNLSFWGDAERMLGVFHLFHFTAFYFILITVMQEWKDWRNLLIAFSGLATFLAVHYLFKFPNNYFGNPAYVAGFLIFGIYFAAIFLLQSSSKYLKLIFAIEILVMLFAIYKTEIAGAYVGLGFSFMLALFLYGILNKNKKLKIITFSVFIALTIIFGLLFINTKSQFVQKNKLISKFVQEFSLEKTTFQTRWIAWSAGAKDFAEHPVLGVGHGNFSVVYERHFDPIFYNYSRVPEYFDRAHNNLIDILSTSGILGLSAYLFMIGAAFFYLISGYKKLQININLYILLSGLLIGYFVQNLAVFDSLATYIPLMVTLGLISWISQESSEHKVSDKPLLNKELGILAAISLFSFLLIFQFNIKPLQAFAGAIEGRKAMIDKGVVAGLEKFKENFSRTSILDRDVRTSFINLVLSSYLLNEIDIKTAADTIEFTINLAKKNVEYNESDSQALTRLAKIMNESAVFYRADKDKNAYYVEQAEETINKSLHLAPNRIENYFVKAQVMLLKGDLEQAEEVLAYAVSLNKNFYESFCQLAKIQLLRNKQEGYENLNVCINETGFEFLTSIANSSSFVKKSASYYLQKDNLKMAQIFFTKWKTLEPKSVDAWYGLLKIHTSMGQYEKARGAAEQIKAISPALRDEINDLVNKFPE